MNGVLRNLRRLIDDGMYVVDEGAVAEAILRRQQVRATIARVSFRSELPAPTVRSFRRDNHVRSFRLERSPRPQWLR
jgi:hypothetical protein